MQGEIPRSEPGRRGRHAPRLPAPGRLHRPEAPTPIMRLSKPRLSCVPLASMRPAGSPGQAAMPHGGRVHTATGGLPAYRPPRPVWRRAVCASAGRGSHAVAAKPVARRLLLDCRAWYCRLTRAWWTPASPLPARSVPAASACARLPAPAPLQSRPPQSATTRQSGYRRQSISRPSARPRPGWPD